MPPAASDNDNATPLGDWLARCPSFAADFPRGILTVGGEGQSPASVPAVAPLHSIGDRP